MDKRMGRKSERYWHRPFSVSPPCFSLSLTHFLSHSPLIVSLSDPLRLLFIVIFRDILLVYFPSPRICQVFSLCVCRFRGAAINQLGDGERYILCLLPILKQILRPTKKDMEGGRKEKGKRRDERKGDEKTKFIIQTI